MLVFSTMWRVLGIAAVVVAVVLGVVIYQGQQSTTPPPTPTAEKTARPIAYRVVQVKEANLGANLAYSGDVKAKTQVAISAKAVGRIDQMRVDMGSEVKAGEVLAALEHSALDAQLKQAEAALLVAQARLSQMEAGSRPETVAQAEANLDTMRQKLASARVGSRAEAVAQAEANLDSLRQKLAAAKAGSRAEAIAQAEANLKGAEARLAQLLAGPTKEQIEVAKTNVRLAKNNLYSIQTRADAYRGSMAAAVGALVYTKGMKEADSGVGYEQVQLAEAQLAQLLAKPAPEQVAQAQAAVDAAREQLKLVKDPLTEWDLAQLENAVRVAEEQVKLVRNPLTGWDLAQLENAVRVAGEQAKLARQPHTKEDLDVARAGVTQAQSAVDLVKTQLGDTTITAPFDGVVAERFLAAGALASPGAPIMSLISSDLEIVLSVEEARSGMLKVGQPVVVQVGAYPGQDFKGSISSIAPTVDPRTRTLAVKVTVQDEKKQLKAGMYARVTISGGQTQTGLVVPKEAVVKRGDRDVVFAVIDGKAQLRDVQVGATDGNNVQILRGVSGGEAVVQNPGTALQNGDSIG